MLGKRHSSGETRHRNQIRPTTAAKSNEIIVFQIKRGRVFTRNDGRRLEGVE